MKYQLLISLMIVILVVIRVHLQILKLLIKEERRRLIKEKKELKVDQKIQCARLRRLIKNKDQRLEKTTKVLSDLFLCISFLCLVCASTVFTSDGKLDDVLIKIEMALSVVAFVLVVVGYSRINKYVK